MQAAPTRSPGDGRAAVWTMKGKTVLFTGASRGMGRFAAVELARHGAKILVVGHSHARGSAAVEAIRENGGSAEFLHADMGDADDVSALAEALLRQPGSIDVLIHSAGGLQPSAARTREGVDRGFAQNFLGAFLLTRLLEDRLLASAPARLIAVGSSTHRFVKKADLDRFLQPLERRMSSFQKGSNQMESYQMAKFAVTTWIYGLARRWLGRGVTANLLDPRIVKGEFGAELESPIRLFFRVASLFADPIERASEQYVRLAADPTLTNVSGMYFVSGKEKPEGSSPLSLDPDVQQRINGAAEAWAASFLQRPPVLPHGGDVDDEHD